MFSCVIICEILFQNIVLTHYQLYRVSVLYLSDINFVPEPNPYQPNRGETILYLSMKHFETLFEE